MKYILAIDSFKESLSSAEAESAARKGILSIDADADVVAVDMADGGEGMLDAFRQVTESRIVEADVHDPMMRRIKARYAITDAGIAIIETAKAIGLALLNKEERNPMRATSYGAGELIIHAWEQGCRRFLIGLGGSATSDCGIGMLRALVDKYAPKGNMDDVRQRLQGIEVTIACDVNNPLCGERGAAHVFAPQKGATPQMVDDLERRAIKFAEVSALHHGYDRSNLPGAGAAGGLGYAFMQYLDAEMKSGAEALLQALRFEQLIDGADHIITGEGSADRQTLMGKLPSIVLRYGKEQGIPVCLIAGKIADEKALREAGFESVMCINPPTMPLEEALRKEVASRQIETAMAQWTRTLSTQP